MQSIYVPTGQRVNITLSDGTNVWLNARTKIVYPAVFDKSVRQVAVDGEAYFDVAKDRKNSQKNGKIWINKVSVWY